MMLEQRQKQSRRPGTLFSLSVLDVAFSYQLYILFVHGIRLSSYLTQAHP